MDLELAGLALVVEAMVTSHDRRELGRTSCVAVFLIILAIGRDG